MKIDTYNLYYTTGSIRIHKVAVLMPAPADYITIRKAFELYKESVLFNRKVLKATPPGLRWITVKPHGGKGRPVMVKDLGEGEAVVVGGAKGSMNMLRLTGIKSKEEYRREAIKRKREERKEKKRGEEEVEPAIKEKIRELKKEMRARRKLDKEMDDIENITKIKNPDEANNKAKELMIDIEKDMLQTLKKEEIDLTAPDVDKERVIEILKEEYKNIATKNVRTALTRMSESLSGDTGRIKERLDEEVDKINQYNDLKKSLEKTRKKDKDIREIENTTFKTAEDAKEAIDSLTIGETTKITESDLTENVVEGLINAAEREVAYRQAALNSSLYSRVATRESEHFITDGNDIGFNSLSLDILKREGLNPYTVSVLGVNASAAILANQINNNRSKDEVSEILSNLEEFHKAHSEGYAEEVKQQGEEFISSATDIREEMDMLDLSKPENILIYDRLNNKRKEYLKEAHKITGQTVGSLEASASLIAELKANGSKKPLVVEFGRMDIESQMEILGLNSSDYDIDGTKAIIKSSAYEKLGSRFNNEDIKIRQEIRAIKNGASDEPGWLPAGIISRPSDSFIDPEPKNNSSLEQQSVENTPKTQESLYRTLGELPESTMAFKNANDLTRSELYDVRKYWEEHIYKGSRADILRKDRFFHGEGISENSSWSKFSAQGKDNAHEQIRADLTDNYSESDMFGNKILHPLAKVVEGDIDSYKNVPGGSALIQDIKDLKNDISEGYVKSDLEAKKELSVLEKDLPDKLKNLYDGAMREHYLKNMSGVAQFYNDRKEGSPWSEYQKVLGGSDKAVEAVLEKLKGDFLTRYAKNHGRVHGESLSTANRSITNASIHTLGMLDKETRDSYLSKSDREMKKYLAAASERSGGKFAKGKRAEKAAELFQKDQEEKEKQGGLFGEDELSSQKSYHVTSLGDRAEKNLESMLPEMSAQFKRGEKVSFFPNLTMSSNKNIQQQRAIKMFEKSKRMNLTFGTGKGKSLTAIGAYTNLKDKGKVNRAIFAVPAVVQDQFGAEMHRFTDPMKYKWSSESGLSRDERISRLKNNSNDMVIFTHQGLRDDLIYLMSKRNNISENDMKIKFNNMNPFKRAREMKSTLDDNGIKFDMAVTDESHYEVQRKNKEDSTLSNVLDALNKNSDYVLRQSATPVKNDLSEAYDMLKKVDSGKFDGSKKSIKAFEKRYPIDTPMGRKALRELVDKYNYASPTVTGVQTTEKVHDIKLDDNIRNKKGMTQKESLAAVNEWTRRAKRAYINGDIDLEAMENLVPEKFEGKSQSEKEKIAYDWQPKMMALKRNNIRKVVNEAHQGAKIDAVSKILKNKNYSAAEAKKVNMKTEQSTGLKGTVKAGDRQPAVIFAHNKIAVTDLVNRLKNDGLRVGVMTGNSVEKVKSDFWKGKYDTLVLSDASATGLNLQNSKILIQYDIPDTASVSQQRDGRINRHGQLHSDIEYHKLRTETQYDRDNWNRVQRKADLGAVFQEDPDRIDDSGMLKEITEKNHSDIDRNNNERFAA